MICNVEPHTLAELTHIAQWQDAFVGLMADGFVEVQVPNHVAAMPLFRVFLRFGFDMPQRDRFLQFAVATTDLDRRVRETRTPPPYYERKFT